MLGRKSEDFKNQTLLYKLMKYEITFIQNCSTILMLKLIKVYEVVIKVNDLRYVFFFSLYWQ